MKMSPGRALWEMKFMREGVVAVRRESGCHGISKTNRVFQIMLLLSIHFHRSGTQICSKCFYEFPKLELTGLSPECVFGSDSYSISEVWVSQLRIQGLYNSQFTLLYEMPNQVDFIYKEFYIIEIV